jgi:hypothetical protein
MAGVRVHICPNRVVRSCMLQGATHLFSCVVWMRLATPSYSFPHSRVYAFTNVLIFHCTQNREYIRRSMLNYIAMRDAASACKDPCLKTLSPAKKVNEKRKKVTRGGYDEEEPAPST